MVRVIGSVARCTTRTSTDKTIAVLIPTPQLVESSLVATWTAARWRRSTWYGGLKRYSFSQSFLTVPALAFQLDAEWLRRKDFVEIGLYGFSHVDQRPDKVVHILNRLPE